MVAKPYFITALIFFGVQILFGLITGLQYIVGDFLFPVLPFNVARVVHTNLVILWLLFGFMGATYYLLPAETETELYAPKLAIFLFWAFLAISILTILGYLLFSYATLVQITKDPFWATMGREYLEQPTIFKFGIFIVIVGFLYNIGMTIRYGRKTVINQVLLIGLTALGILFLLAFYNPDNLVISKYFGWWVIHLWLEGIWILIMAALLAFILLNVTGVERQFVERWLLIISFIALITSIMGTSHHYYWIGTPEYWQWWGSIFSALQPLPFFLIAVFVFHTLNHRRYQYANQAINLWLLGTGVMAFLGAGVWGFLQSLAPINYYTHGTQITSAHSHLSFFGAYGMIILTFMSYTKPFLRKQDVITSPLVQQLEKGAFWLMTLSMIFMAIFLTASGILQVYYQRISANPLPFMVVQDELTFLYWLREITGLTLLAGLIVYVASWLKWEKSEKPPMENVKVQQT
jgi:nitric oxide reductase subunit B